MILDSLKNCTRTAWILPVNMAHRMAQSVRQSNLHSDVGNEEYFRSDLSLVLGGFVPEVALRRLDSVKESGIFEWWHQLNIKWMYHKDYSVIQPREPSMKGNILVIFIVWSVGIGLGIFSCLFENYTKLFTVVKVLINVFIKTFRKIVTGLNLCIRRGGSKIKKYWTD